MKSGFAPQPWGIALTSKHRKQLTLAVSDFQGYLKPTRRAKFLAKMDSVVQCKELAALIEPLFPKSTSADGRPAFGLEQMLRIHCLRLWFDLSDPAAIAPATPLRSDPMAPVISIQSSTFIHANCRIGAHHMAVIDCVR